MTADNLGGRWLPAAWLVAVLLLGAVACSTVRDAPRIVEMPDAELDRYCARVSAQVAAVAGAALAEGDLSPDVLRGIATALRGAADGTSAPAVGSLAGWLDVDGYGAAALTLAIMEIDAEMERRGAFEAPAWPALAKVMRAIAAGLEGAAP